MKKFCLLFVLLFIVTLTGCKKDPVPEPEPDTVYYTYTFYIDNTEYTTKYKEGELVSFPDEDGKIILGWSTTKDLKNIVDFPADYKACQDLVLYAKYKKELHTISLELNGGNGEASIEVAHGKKASKLPAPTKLNYVFAGWYLDSDFETEYDPETIVTKNFTLYAKYEMIDYNDILAEIPDVIDKDIELPYEMYDCYLDWKCDKNYILGDGTYNPGKFDVTCTLSVVIALNDDSDYVTLSKEVSVKGYSLEKLPEVLSVGYISSWNYKSFSDDVLDNVDVFCISFAFVNEDATLDLSSLTGLITTGVRKIHERGKRAVLSIQGYGKETENFSNLSKDPIKRRILAENMAKAVIEYHLDGIDIDWEYPGSASNGLDVDRRNYTLLLEDIRKEISKYDSESLLTAAIPAGPYMADRYELKQVSEILDYINMMSYDLESPSKGSLHCALYDGEGTVKGCSIDSTISQWTHLGVSKDKICLGMAFYGKKNITRTTTNDGLNQATINSNYTNIQYSKLSTTFFKFITNTINYHFDRNAKVPYLFQPKSKTFYTYDNEASVIEKCHYAIINNLRGVMIWELGEDNTDTLINATKQGLGNAKNNLVCYGEVTLDLNSIVTIKPINEYYLSQKFISFSISINGEVTDVSNQSYNNKYELHLTKKGDYIVKCCNEANVELGTLIIHVK